MTEIPDTVVKCDGCDEDLNLLNAHLTMQLKAERSVLLTDDKPATDPLEVPEATITLGKKSGRGVIRNFHDFDCMAKWVKVREGLKAKLEYHSEDEIYVPDDNRSPQELVAAGEMTKATMRAIDTTPADGGEE